VVTTLSEVDHTVRLVWCTTTLSEVATVSVVSVVARPHSVRWPQSVWCPTTLSEVATVSVVPAQ
jgi:hypothetical protein